MKLRVSNLSLQKLKNKIKFLLEKKTPNIRLSEKSNEIGKWINVVSAFYTLDNNNLSSTNSMRHHTNFENCPFQI